MTSHESPANLEENLEIEQALTEVEQTLNDLENRYHQIKEDWLRRSELVVQRHELEQKKVNNPLKEPVKTQLNHIQQELSRLELNLESILLPDLFWQVVRFVGIGILVGWGLKAIAG